MRQKMMTKEIERKLPGEWPEGVISPLVYIHYFHAIYDWHWYIIAGKKVITNERHSYREPKEGEETNDWLFETKVFNYICPDGEYGTVYLSDLLDFGKDSIPVERDYLWEVKPIEECNEN